MINKRVTEPQKTASLDAPVTTITLAAKPIEKTTTVTETTTDTSTTITAPQYVASGIELNIPVEKIEAEKKSAVGVNQAVMPPSTAAAGVEAREPSSSTQSNAKKDKKEKKRKFVRMAAGTVWEDQTLGDWDLGAWLVFSHSVW